MSKRSVNVAFPQSGDLRKRLRRIEGQVRGVQQMLADGRDCKEVVEQLAAAKKAFDSASMMAVVALSQCASPNDGTEPTLTDEEFRKLASTLA
jgi:DNA-binding FrmR family transcriptional regulator